MREIAGFAVYRISICGNCGLEIKKSFWRRKRNPGRKKTRPEAVDFERGLVEAALELFHITFSCGIYG